VVERGLIAGGRYLKLTIELDDHPGALATLAENIAATRANIFHITHDRRSKSLAIGTPADGFYALRAMKDTGGSAEDVTDDEIRDGIKLLAETEGIFAETAGGVTVGVAKKLIASGKIPHDSSAVICVTGHGLKTLDAVIGHCGQPREIKPSLREFEALVANEVRTVNA
jgi:threonine synthase